MLRQHALHRLLRHQKATEDADRDRLRHLVGDQIDEGAARAVARVINDHIRCPEGGFDVGKKLYVT